MSIHAGASLGDILRDALKGATPMQHELQIHVKHTPVTRVERTVMHLPKWLAEYMVHRNKITAIKEARVTYRDHEGNNLSLRQAKRIVESFGFETDVGYEE